MGICLPLGASEVTIVWEEKSPQPALAHRDTVMRGRALGYSWPGAPPAELPRVSEPNYKARGPQGLRGGESALRTSVFTRLLSVPPSR